MAFEKEASRSGVGKKTENGDTQRRGPAPAHIAERIDLFGKGRILDDATIKHGYGFLISSGTPYFFHVTDVEQPLRSLIDVRSMPEGMGGLSAHLPQPAFDVAQTKKGLKAINVRPHARWHKALVHARHLADPAQMRISIPGVAGEGLILASDAKTPSEDGFYTATVWKAIPVLHDAFKNDAERYIIQLHEPFSWQTSTIDNAEALRADEAFIGELVAPLIDQVRAHIRERAGSLSPSDVDELLRPIRTVLPFEEQCDVDLTDAIKEGVREEVRSQRAQIDTVTYLRLLHVLGADGLEKELLAALEQVVDDHVPARVVDLETDGTTIWEMGIADARRSRRFSGQQQINAALAHYAGDIDRHVWIGHNLEEWDAPVLARHGFDLGGALRWDTLRIEALLSPRRRALALAAAHRADEDAALTYRLFRSQVLRLLLGYHPLTSAHIKALLQPVWTYVAALKPLFELMQPDKDLRREIARRCQAETEKLLVQKSHGEAMGPLRRQLEALPAETGSVHVVYPRTLGALVASLPGVWFADEEGSELGLEVRAQQEEAETYEDMLASAYERSAVAMGYAPLLAAMPAWPKARIEPLRAQYCRPALPDGEGKVWCFPSDYYLRAGVEAPDVLMLVEPELDKTVNTRVVRTLSRAALYAYLDEYDAWGRLRAARSLWQLTDRQAAALLPAPGYPSHAGCSYWLRRTRPDSYDLIEHVHDFCAAARARWGDDVKTQTVALERRERDERAEVFYLHQELKGSERAPLRLNPETLYRDRYWAIQTLLLEHLVGELEGSVPVLLVSDRDRLEDLKGLFHELHWYVPEGAVHRQLELLRAHRHPRKVAVWPFEYFSHVLEANVHVGQPLLFVVDALPLQEQYHLGKAEKGEAEQRVDGREEALHALVERVGEEAGDEAEEEVEDVSALLNRFSLFQAFRLLTPRLTLMLSLIKQHHEGHRVAVLDARLEPVSVPEGFPRLKRISIPAFGKQQFEARLQQVQRRIQSAQPPLEVDLEEAWQEVLERIFLPRKELDRETARFRDEQRDYLEKIIRREQDVLVEMPTGGGKSVLFQAPALYHGLKTNCLTVVVTPLKALMEDQVDALRELGFLLEVDFVSGDLPYLEVKDIYRRIAGGELFMVYVAPERFRVRSFMSALQDRLEVNGDLVYCVFDEAHCISLWGLDFRPDYLVPVNHVRAWREEGRRMPCIFLSATVTEQVYKDITERFV